MTLITKKNFIEHRQPEQNKKAVSFGSAGLTGALSGSTVTGAVQYLHSNPVGGVVLSDVLGMIIPRTTIDYVEQNHDYGMETLREETIPMIFNPFGPSIVAAGLLGAKGLSGVYAGRDEVKALGEAWKAANGNPEDYIRKVYKDAIAHYGDNQTAKLSEQQLNEIVHKAKEAFNTPPSETKAIKKLKGEISEAFTQATGGASIELEINGTKISTNSGRLIHDVISVGQQFKEKAADQVDGVVKKLQDLSKTKTLWGAGISIAGLMAFPYLNKAYTKWSTGKDYYVAYKNLNNGEAREPEKTEQEKDREKRKLLGMKALSAAGMLGIITASLGGPKSLKPSTLLKKIELKDKMPGMDLIRVMYGSLCTFRILSSRDETEVENRTIRDYWGFVNWLVLGPVVAKGIMSAADKTILKRSGDGKGFMNWIKNVSIPSHSEVRAMTAKLPKAERLKKMAVHNGGIIGGLVYSIGALGIGVTLLNNWLTNRAEKKKLAALELNDQHIYGISMPKIGLAARNNSLYSDFSKRMEKVKTAS